MRFSKEAIPWGMAAGRAALGPMLVLGAASNWNGMTLAAMVVTALVSDIFDGVLARRWRCDSAALRLFDSMADTFFYLCAGCALVMTRSAMWNTHAVLLSAVVGLEICRFAFDFWKFGKPACYHSYLAKAWGLILAAAVVGTFAMARVSPLMTAALVVGIASLLEGLAMTAILPVWTRDVKTLGVAWRLRRSMYAQARRARVRQRRAGRIMLAAARP